MIRFKNPKDVIWKGGLEPFKPKVKRDIRETTELTYLQKLALFIPGPIISVFSSLKEITPKEYISWATGAAVVLLIIYYLVGQKNITGAVKFWTILFSLIAFALYIYTNGDYLFNWIIPEEMKWAASFVSIIYVFMVGLLEIKIETK